MHACITSSMVKITFTSTTTNKTAVLLHPTQSPFAKLLEKGDHDNKTFIHYMCVSKN